MPLTQPDPFTQIHGAIWRALTANQTFCQMVPLGRRINSIPGVPALGQPISGINAKAIAMKATALQPGDVPEVRISQRAFGRDLERTNSEAIFYWQTYLMQLGTSNQLQDLTPLNQLKHVSIVALEVAGMNLGLPGVVSAFDFRGAPEKDVEAETGLKLWYAVLPITVNYYLPNQIFASIP